MSQRYRPAHRAKRVYALCQGTNTQALINSHLEEMPLDPRDIVSRPEPAAKAIIKTLAKYLEGCFAGLVESIGATEG